MAKEVMFSLGWPVSDKDRIRKTKVKDQRLVD